MVPGHRRLAVSHLGGLLQTRTFEEFSLLKTNHLLMCGADRRQLTGVSTDDLFTLQHGQVDGDFITGRLVSAGDRDENSLTEKRSNAKNDTTVMSLKLAGSRMWL